LNFVSNSTSSLQISFMVLPAVGSGAGPPLVGALVATASAAGGVGDPGRDCEARTMAKARAICVGALVAECSSGALRASNDEAKRGTAALASS